MSRRLLMSVLTLLVIATITFVLIRSVPGGPFSSERNLPAEIEKNLLARYRLDEPLWKQYARWLGNAVRGDLGPSFTQESRTVNDIIREGFPKSAMLGLTAFILACGIGIPAGIASAVSTRGESRNGLRRLRLVDRTLMASAVVGVSVPSFIIASLLQYVLTYSREWQPAPLHRLTENLPPAGWGDSPAQLMMPALALAAFPAAFLSRLVRSSVITALSEDYIRTARAKGLAPRRVIVKHALRNALLPVVTYAGPLLATLLTGSFVVEDIFAIPGLGRLFVSSINDRDYTVLLGVTVFYSALLIGLNAIVDILYAVIDPRIRNAAQT